MNSSSPKEGLQVLRFIMVLSSMAPLFVLWAVRGSGTVPDIYFIPGCLVLAVVPTVILGVRIRTAKETNDCQAKMIYRADDHRARKYQVGDVLAFHKDSAGFGRLQRSMWTDAGTPRWFPVFF